MPNSGSIQDSLAVVPAVVLRPVPLAGETAGSPPQAQAALRLDRSQPLATYTAWPGNI